MWYSNMPEHHFDWKSLWERLEWDDEVRERETAQVRFRQRAEQYAALLPDHDSEAGNTQDTLLFDLGEEVYGIQAALVRTVRTINRITTVPGTPPFYRGVVNVRGQIITVMDLRLFFGMEVSNRNVPGELIVVWSNRLEIGLLADHVRDVVSVADAAIEPMDDMRYARGMTANHVIMLDIARVFEDERLIIGGIDE